MTRWMCRVFRGWAAGDLRVQTKPSVEGDLSRDVKGDLLDLRPTSQQGKIWNLGDPKDQREILWLICKKRCSVQSRTMSRSGEEELGSCTISVATHCSSLFRA